MRRNKTTSSPCTVSDPETAMRTALARDFDPLNASESELRALGFPARPKDATHQGFGSRCLGRDAAM